MDTIKKFIHTLWGIVRPGGVVVGVVAMLVGFFVDVSGSTTFWSLSTNDWTRLGLTLIAVFGAITVLRHEYLIREFDNIWANEHARSLYQDGIPPIREAYFQYVRNGNFGVVNRFWNAGIVSISDPNNVSDLQLAAENGHAAILRGIIEHGGDPRKPNRQGRTPLMLAASRGRAESVKVLLEHDCALNASATEDGVSALYAASANGHSAVVDLLIAADVDIDTPDHENITPLMAAIGQNNWAIAEKLVDAGADLKKVDAFGATIANYVSSGRGATENLVKQMEDAGVLANETLERTGGGHSGTGKVRVHWKAKTG